MSLLKWVVLLLLPLLAACSDDRASFQIETSDHALTLIRDQRFFWSDTAEYTIVAAHMPTCMRRHKLESAPLDAKVEVYAPGNNAWILKQDDVMYVVETRTCEGFARLMTPPEGGMGPLVGTFEEKGGTLTFIVAQPLTPLATSPLPETPQTSQTPPQSAVPASSALVPETGSAPTAEKNEPEATPASAGQ